MTHLQTKLLALTGFLLACVGCTQTTQNAIDEGTLQKHRARLVLQEEPAGAQAVLDIREAFTGISDEDLEDHLAQAVEDGDEDEELEFTADDLEVEISPVSAEPRDVVIVGKIGGMPNPWTETEPDFPWKEGSATLFLVDPATAAEFGDEEHAHDDSCDCPFCARKATERVDSVATVNFIDEAGKVIDLPAGPLLDLNERDTVVVRGRAHLIAGKMLVIDADGIYVRR